jgi:hypothetical protein
MTTPTSSLIIKHYNGFGGNFIDSQYLAASYDTGTPAELGTKVMKIFSAKNRFYDSKPLLQLIGAPLTTKELDTDVFRWTLQGAEDKDAYVLESIDVTNITPGLNNTTFRVKLDLDYFAFPDVIMGEDSDYPMQVVEKLTDGTGTIYTLKLETEDPTAFVPPYLLEQGKRFSKVWTSVPNEYSTTCSLAA